MKEQEIGYVSKYFGQISVAAIEITAGKISVGDTIHIKGHTTDLNDEITINETMGHRIIGLTIETRTDCVDVKTILTYRELNVTRVQIGVQHIDDNILKNINRNCYTADTIKSTNLLKQNG